MSPDDINGAFAMARNHVIRTGECDHITDEEERGNAIDRAERALVYKCEDEAKEFFREPKNRARLDAVAARLKVGPIDSDEELQRILDSVV